MQLRAQSDQPHTLASRRIGAIDIARGFALAAMAVYHFAWDLEFFGYVEPGLTATGGWKVFARSIASSFLALVGVSLFLAHGERVRWGPFWRRFAMVVAAAAAITLATRIAMPQGVIFFGILHQIALASLIGLAFLRLPWPAVALLAAGVIAAPHFLRTPLLDAPLWWWSGLSQTVPRSNDYVPVFPWLGAVLAGIALAQLAARTRLCERLAGLGQPRWGRLPAIAGRHSLLVYLVHQPILISLVYLFSLVAPAADETPEVRFRLACEQRCEAERSEEFCAFYCVCVLDRIETENLLDATMSSRQNDELDERLTGFAALCTAQTEERLSQGGVE